MQSVMSDIKLFEEKKVRTHWDVNQEKWFFSVIDVVEILTGSSIPKRYWSDQFWREHDEAGKRECGVWTGEGYKTQCLNHLLQINF